MEISGFTPRKKRQAPRSSLQARTSPLKAPMSSCAFAAPFSIKKCPLNRDFHSGVFEAAEIGDDPGHLHWGGGAQKEVVVIFGADQIGQLPESLAEPVLPLLQLPDDVKFSVRPCRMTSVGTLVSQTTAEATPPPAAAAAASGVVRNIEIWVQPLKRSRTEQDATEVRKLLAALRSAACRLRRPSVCPLNVGPVCMIMERLSARDIFAQARRVDKTWKVAAHRVTPLTSCRRQVAESMVQEPAVPSAYASQPPAASQSPAATQPPPAAQPPAASQPPAPDTAEATAERVLPPAEWFLLSNFESCGGEDIMLRLEDAVRWLDRLAQEQEEGRGDDDRAPVGHGQGMVRVKCERLKAQLPVLRRLCAEKKLFPAATPRANVSGETSPAETSATRAFGVRASSAEVTAASAATSAAAQEAEDRGRATGGHRWDGWAVFALVVALCFSEDRAFLCRWTMRGLAETGGLPRSQIIEILCKMHQTLLPPGRVGTEEPTGFQTASAVATVWDRKGSYRLRQDLRACIKAMEGCFLSLPWPATTQRDQGCSQSQSSASRHYVNLSKLTPEQQAVVNTSVYPGYLLKVVAFAGMGKTLCLRAWAQLHPKANILYITFNKSVSVEAGLSFPRNVTCNTINAVSLKGDLSNYTRGDGGHLTCTAKELQSAITAKGCEDGPAKVQRANAKDVMDTLNAFWQSADNCVMDRHFRSKRRTPSSGKYVVNSQWVLRTARAAWGWMQKEDGLRMTYAGILKLFQLRQKPDDLELGKNFDVIMLDEAQDVNDCTAAIVLEQTKCGIIIVGDPHQTIYGWNGARDHITKARANKTLYLTQVFRFGVAIASVANAVISVLKGETRPLLGSLALSNSPPAQVMLAIERLHWLDSDREAKGDYTFLARTNAGLIQEALASTARGERVGFLNGTHSVKFWEVSDLCTMMLGKKLRSGANPELRACGSIQKLREQLDSSEESDLSSFGPKLQLIDTMMEGGKTPTSIIADIQNLESVLKSGNRAGPVMTLSTVHRSKGLEFDTVVLANDFKITTMAEGQPVRSALSANANLLYVAITRAKRLLVLNPDLSNQLSLLGMWDSLSVRGSALDASLGLPGPCCTCGDAVQAAAEGVAGGSDVPLRDCIVYAGSMSKNTVCETCVKGGGEGERESYFPYAAELLPQSA